MARLPKSFVERFDKKELKEKGLKFVLVKEKIKNKDFIYEYAIVDKMMYVRDYDTKRPVGIVIINKGMCGWSLCHDNDEWDKELGIYKAICKLNSKKTIKEANCELKSKMDKHIFNKKLIKNKIRSYNLKMLSLCTILNFILDKKENN